MGTYSEIISRNEFEMSDLKEDRPMITISCEEENLTAGSKILKVQKIQREEKDKSKVENIALKSMESDKSREYNIQEKLFSEITKQKITLSISGKKKLVHG